MQKGIQKVRQCTNLKSHSRSISFWRVVLSVCRYEDNLLLLSSLHFPLRFSMISTFLVIATAAGELVVKSGGLETWFDCEVQFLVSDFDVKNWERGKIMCMQSRSCTTVEKMQVLFVVSNKYDEWETNKRAETGLSRTCHSLVFFLHAHHFFLSGWAPSCLYQVFVYANQSKSCFFLLVNICLLKIFLQKALKGLLRGSWWERRLLDNCRFVCFFKLFQDFQGFIAGGVWKGWNKGSVLHSVEGGESLRFPETLLSL